MTIDLAPRRSRCPIEHVLGIVGDRWTLLVVRDLLIGGKRRFAEFRAAGEGIATNILSDRLKRLEAQALVTRRTDPDNRRQVLYEPTSKAVDLAPMLLEMVRWSAKHDPDTVVPEALLRRIECEPDRVLAEMLEKARQDADRA